MRKTTPTSYNYVPEYPITWLKRLHFSANRFNTKRIKLVKVNPDNEILFRLMDGLTADTAREDVAIVDICDTREDMGQMATEVKIPFQMSHNTLTSAEEYILMEVMHLKSEIAQRTLSDLGREVHAWRIPLAL